MIIAIRPLGATNSKAEQSIVSALATSTGPVSAAPDQVEMIVMGADGHAVSLVQRRDGLRPGDLVTLTEDSHPHVIRAGNQPP